MNVTGKHVGLEREREREREEIMVIINCLVFI